MSHVLRYIFVMTNFSDRAALERYRARWANHAHETRFLHELARAQIHERLALVNRAFKRPLIVTGHPHLWHDFAVDAEIIADTPHWSVNHGHYDLVVHAMALHWSDDPVGQLIQARHALAPDGLMLAVLIGGRSLLGLRDALAHSEARLMAGLSPRVAPMADLRDMGGLLTRAGLALPVADSEIVSVTYRDMFHLMQDIRAMGESNALALRHKRVPPRALFFGAAAEYQAEYCTHDGRVKAEFELIFLTGWSPHSSQPKPMRPGSATTRLADALSTHEVKLSEQEHGPRD